MLIDESPPKDPLSASDMFALYPHNIKRSGLDECHWCAGNCKREVTHDDTPTVMFKKIQTVARRPNNAYICEGCAIYRRKRTTISYLDGTFLDGKCLMNFSWWIDKDGPKVISFDVTSVEERRLLREKLLTPPNSFCLSLISEGSTNHIQLCEPNDLCVIKMETPLKFTFDNKVQAYSIYELKNGLVNGEVGLEPGTQLLIKLLGGPNKKEEKKPHGRPKGQDWEKSPKMQVAVSGNPTTSTPS